MLFGISKRQGAAPRPAEDLPFFDAEMLTQLLNILDEIPSRVLFNRSMRRTLSRAALIEQHDAISRGIVKLPVLRHNPSARPAVQKHHRLAVRIAALFIIDLV